MAKSLLTYCDTGVVLNGWKGRDDGTFLRLLEDPKRRIAAATILKLELLPMATFHKQVKELEFYNYFFGLVGAWRSVDESLINRSLVLAGAHGLDAIDSLHAAAALDLNVDEFYTSEKLGQRLYRVPGLAVRHVAAIPMG